MVFEILLLFYIINFEKGQIPNIKNIRHSVKYQIKWNGNNITSFYTFINILTKEIIISKHTLMTLTHHCQKLQDFKYF